jgi:cytochrome c nitrite reductase small subunit
VSAATATLIAAVLLGVVLGVGGYTFVFARGLSYLINDPTACVNCHVMREQYDGWMASSHRAVAACNDCHTPHSSLAAKYGVKARNGFWHSVAFTTGHFHEPIQITDRNRSVTESACRHCHGDVVRAIDLAPGHSGPLDCIRCHRSVGHLH